MSEVKYIHITRINFIYVFYASESLDDLVVQHMYKRHVEGDYCIILFSGRLNQQFKSFFGAEESVDAMCSPYHFLSLTLSYIDKFWSFKCLDGVKKALENDLDQF